LDTIAGLRLKTVEGLEVKGSTPIVDDSVDGELEVRWPTDSPKGEIVMTFNESSLSISATGALKNNWFFELSSDQKAKLPFAKIDRQRLSCTFKHTHYVVTARQGTFTTDADFGLRIMPGAEGIALDFSTR
jgi:hypothetical protein